MVGGTTTNRVVNECEQNIKQGGSVSPTRYRWEQWTLSKGILSKVCFSEFNRRRAVFGAIHSTVYSPFSCRDNLRNTAEHMISSQTGSDDMHATEIKNNTMRYK